MYMVKNHRKFGFLKGFASAGLALGMAFAAGFVHINGKPTHVITMQKQKNMDKIKNNFSISGNPNPIDGNAGEGKII